MYPGVQFTHGDIRCGVLVVILPLLPWAPLLRLVGAVLFGPHNYPIWREWRREQEDYELGLTLVKRRAILIIYISLLYIY